MSNKLPEALRLANALDDLPYQIYDLAEPKEAAALLRTQHALLEQSREALRIGIKEINHLGGAREAMPLHDTLAALNQHLEPK